jgi:ABC transporter substrate binding protein
MAARGARAARRPGAADRRAAYAENDSTAQSWLAAFRTALAKLGWTEGSNLRIELRWSAADADTMRTLAKELVDLRPNAIFGVTTPAIGALARETKTIPIVFAGVSDPVGAGYFESLAHPGGRQERRFHQSQSMPNSRNPEIAKSSNLGGELAYSNGYRIWQTSCRSRISIEAPTHSLNSGLEQ